MVQVQVGAHPKLLQAEGDIRTELGVVACQIQAGEDIAASYRRVLKQLDKGWAFEQRLLEVEHCMDWVYGLKPRYTGWAFERADA